MVTFQIGPALLGGFVATLAMTMVMVAGRTMKMTSMDMPLMIGGCSPKTRPGRDGSVWASTC